MRWENNPSRRLELNKVTVVEILDRNRTVNQ